MKGQRLCCPFFVSYFYFLFQRFMIYDIQVSYDIQGYCHLIDADFNAEKSFTGST